MDFGFIYAFAGMGNKTWGQFTPNFRDGIGRSENNNSLLSSSWNPIFGDMFMKWSSILAFFRSLMALEHERNYLISDEKIHSTYVTFTNFMKETFLGKSMVPWGSFTFFFKF